MKSKKVKIYMRVTKDRYELPVAVAESVSELASLTGLGYKTILSYISRNKKGWVKVVLDD